jgi:ATP-dependent RNA helicase DeaD
VDELSETLIGRGLRAESLHGGLSQDQRDRVMTKFRGKKVDLLIATDVAARGLDVKHVSHVVNFDVPADAETYVHRIGRTGRAGREGVAITLAEPREHRLLRNIERQTSQVIEVAQVPTVADLRAHRRELVKATLREAVLEGGLESWRGIVESLATEIDVMDLAAAAVKLVAANDGQEEQEIPAVTPRAPREFDRGPRAPSRHEERFAARSEGRSERGDGAKGKPAGKKPRKEAPWKAATLWIGAGRKLNIRPGDLVGAIANEVGVDSSQIGAIQIADGYSTVEVPESIADDVIDAIKRGKIKGKKVQVRRDRMGR